MFWPFEIWEIMQDKVFTNIRTRSNQTFVACIFLSKTTSMMKTKTYNLCFGYVHIRLKSKFYNFRV